MYPGGLLHTPSDQPRPERQVLGRKLVHRNGSRHKPAQQDPKYISLLFLLGLPMKEDKGVE